MKSLNPVTWFGKNPEVIKRFISFLSAIIYLKSPYIAAKIFREKFGPIKGNLPLPFLPLFLLEKISPWIFFKALKLGINVFASRFIAGNGTQEVLRAIKNYSQKGFLVNLDILGEAVVSESEAIRYQEAYLQLIREIGHKLPYGSLSISLKGSAFYSQFNPCAPEYAAEKICERLRPILIAIKKYGGHAYLDAEEYNFRETHFLIFQKLYKEFGSAIRFVLQSYLRSSGETLNKLIAVSDYKDPVWVRLVRGAYWDFECYRAETLSWKYPPVFQGKQQTDDNYHELLCEGIDNGLRVVPATHNIPSIGFAEIHFQSDAHPVPEYQVLFGIGEEIAKALVKKNIPVRFYMPILFPKGDLAEAMAYLLRRINESQLSFIMQSSEEKLEKALAKIHNLQKRQPTEDANATA